MIYLASPYTDLNPAVREARFQAACRSAAERMRTGHVVLCPVAHSHPLFPHPAAIGTHATVVNPNPR